MKRAGSFTIHQRNIQSLAIEMYKAKNNIGPLLLNEIFIERVYNGPALRKVSDFITPHINSTHYGEDSLKYFGSKIWNLIPCNIIQVENINVFKSLIRNWAPEKCPCRLCKRFILGVVYL